MTGGPGPGEEREPDAEPRHSLPPGPYTHGSAFTPPEGIPVIALPPEDARWQDRMRTFVRLPVTERPGPWVALYRPDAGHTVSVPRGRST